MAKKILPLFDEVPDAFHELTGNSNQRLGSNDASVSYFVGAKIIVIVSKVSVNYSTSIRGYLA